MRSFRLLDLILPQHCAGCARPATGWCAGCARSFGPARPVDRPGLAAAYSLADYRGPARRAVLAYKERGHRALAAPFGRALAAALPAIRAGPVALVPAPSRPAAARARGGQHMTTVARRCADHLSAAGTPAVVVPALHLDRRAADSVGLTAEARTANLRGRLRPDPRHRPPPGTPAILLDDVITTGATAIACTAVLRAAGVQVAAVLALTSTT